MASRSLWAKVVWLAVAATLLFAALASPALTFHPHVNLHETAAHHASPAALPEPTPTLGSLLEYVCLSLDGCHQLGAWLHLLRQGSEPARRSGVAFPSEDAPFSSASLLGLLRPPNSLVALPATSGGLRLPVEAGCRSFTHRS